MLYYTHQGADEYEKKYLIEIDTETNKLTEDVFQTYVIKDMKEWPALLNNDLLKEELHQFMIKELDGDHAICLYCGSPHIHKHGFTKQGKQRYQCACKKTFVLERNTLMYWSHLSCSQWKTIICNTLNNDSLTKTASLAGISETSAFYCRHKLLYVLVQMMNEDILSDEVELKETDINFQEEGYVKAGKRGISRDKIGIACAIDIHDLTVLAVADRGRPTSKTLIEYLTVISRMGPQSSVKSEELSSFDEIYRSRLEENTTKKKRDRRLHIRKNQ